LALSRQRGVSSATMISFVSLVVRSERPSRPS
jgi:hypothetical protein